MVVKINFFNTVLCTIAVFIIYSCLPIMNSTTTSPSSTSTSFTSFATGASTTASSTGVAMATISSATGATMSTSRCATAIASSVGVGVATNTTASVGVGIATNTAASVGVGVATNSAAATAASIAASTSMIPQCDFWMRVGLMLQLCVKSALVWILHNYHNDPTYTGLPDNEVALFNRMASFKNNYQSQLKSIVKPDQWLVLCPPTGKSNAKDWDITLIIIVICYETKLSPPQGGWKQKVPRPGDQSKAAFCLRARELRNNFNHGSINNILTHAQFISYVKTIDSILNGLCYNNMSLFHDLETGTLKMYTGQIVKTLETKLSCLEQFVSDMEIQKVDDNTKRIAAAETNVLDHSKQLSLLQIEAKSVRISTTDLHTASEVNSIVMDNLSGEVRDLLSDISLTKSNVSVLEKKFNISSISINNLQSDFHVMRNWISMLENGKIDGNTLRVNQLQRSVTYTQSGVDFIVADVTLLKQKLTTIENDFNWKMNATDFSRLLFACIEGYDEKKIERFRQLCVSFKLVQEDDKLEIFKDFGEAIEENGKNLSQNVQTLIQIFETLNHRDAVEKLKTFYQCYFPVSSTSKRIVQYVKKFISYLPSFNIKIIFLLGLYFLYAEQIYEHWRYAWCTYGTIRDSQFSFSFKGIRDPYQLNYVWGNVEFDWNSYQHYFPTIKPHSNKNMHYFLNTNRCILGNVRDVGNSFTGKKPVRGAEIFAVPGCCTEVWFHDDNNGYWKKYISATNISCTKLGKKKHTPNEL
ncbi:uncharacterized protein LOC130629256 isoform X1 [Hydractinia symbiolongicarpus]|uniref:uncharacterized protein LOC130629256 isoform X1 n=2 Tax=Hydractinia symbiolongicarpus TaxID=13093 RepID=UPI00254AD9C4|nr:uncharacterized protein LOC130629256 isoform X1 [Hydractinia symbiolongicarpus]